MREDNPYRPPIATAVGEPDIGDIEVDGDDARLCSSVALWMRMAGVAYVVAGVLWLMASAWLLREVDLLVSATFVVAWVVPEILVLLAGVWLLRAGNALAGVGTGTGTLASAFGNLRWHLLAVGLAPVLQLLPMVDVIAEVLP